MFDSCKVAFLFSALHLSSCMHAPAVPGQEFVINPDGSYRYSYDTNTGGFQTEQKQSDGSVAGSYGFNAPGGGSVNVQYSAPAGVGTGEEHGSSYGTAGTSGFRKSSYSSSGSSGQSYTGPSYGAAASTGTGAKGTYTLKLKPAGEYSYEYNLNDQAKSEIRGADGRVRGQFSFTDPQGVNKAIHYTADEEGFKAQGAHIPTDGQTAGAAGYGASGGAAASSLYSSSSQHQASGFGGQRTSYGDANRGTLTLNMQPSGAYSYSYSLNDQQKTETRDQDGKVKGAFSFTDPEGQKKAIEYTADEGGFQATGDHIPVVGQTEAVAGSYDAGFGSVGSSFTGTQYTSKSSSSHLGGHSTAKGPVGSGTMSMQLQPDGQYTYNYKLNDQAKTESRNADGVVTGEFSFTNPEGQNLAIRYKADEGGFRAEGDHIPKPSEEFLAAHRAAAAQASSYRAQEGYASGNAEYSAGGSYDSSLSGGFESGAQSGPFAFSYNAGDHSHSQSSSGSGSVSGQYTANTAGGSTKVSYSAQSKQGYNPAVETSAQVGSDATRFTGTGNFDNTKYTSAHGAQNTGFYGNTGTGLGLSSGGSGGAYSFSYSAEDHAHSQDKANAGAVQGEYSASGEGSSQKVSYSAGGKQGYQATVQTSANVGAGAGKASTYQSGGGSFSSYSATGAGSHLATGAGSHLATGAGSHLATGSQYKTGGDLKTGSFGSGKGQGYSYSYETSSQEHQAKATDGNVEGKYSVSGIGSNQQSSYTASEQGFLPTHDISINVGEEKTKASY